MNARNICYIAFYLALLLSAAFMTLLYYNDVNAEPYMLALAIPALLLFSIGLPGYIIKHTNLFN